MKNKIDKISQPTYYAIIPAEVRYCNEIPPAARLLFGEIMCLANKCGYCYASNEFLGELYGVNPTTISEWVKQLDDKGFINSVVKGKNRKITINTTLRKKPKSSLEKPEPASSEKVEHNNTSINNINNNNISNDKVPAEAGDVIKKLNEEREKKKDEVKVLVETIMLFVEIDPVNKTLTTNHAQRAAAKFLLNEYGIDKIKIALNVIKDSQKFNLPYFPTITTPMDLKNKWVKLRNAYNRYQNDKAKTNSK